MRRQWAWGLMVLWMWGGGRGVAAQEMEASGDVEETTAEMVDVAAPPRPMNLDERLMYAMYEVQSPALLTYLHAVDLSVYPAVLGGPLVVWGAAPAGNDGSGRAALDMFLSEASAGIAFFTLKQVFRRTRPYVVLPDVHRRRRKGPVGRSSGTYSFPSGHTAVVFAQATSLTASYPEWYVAVPAFLWATSAGVSRVWYGLHYPTDVAAGAALGVLAATVVHRAGSRDDEEDRRGEPQATVFHLRLRF